ncbi:MAG: hypothetical protein J6M31_09250 [Bacteroidales bacterium]|nr:hypothetical protein [Bacteroidales bacterium]
MPISLNIASLAKDGLVLSDARNYAQHILDGDPLLSEERNALLAAVLRQDRYAAHDYSRIS